MITSSSWFGDHQSFMTSLFQQPPRRPPRLTRLFLIRVCFLHFIRPPSSSSLLSQLIIRYVSIIICFYSYFHLASHSTSFLPITFVRFQFFSYVSSLFNRCWLLIYWSHTVLISFHLCLALGHPSYPILHPLLLRPPTLSRPTLFRFTNFDSIHLSLLTLIRGCPAHRHDWCL